LKRGADDYEEVKKILGNGLGVIPDKELISAVLEKEQSKKNYPQCFT
jgi:hypothetical protein